MNEFRLTVSLGNAEMQTGRDVASLLRVLAKKIEDNDFSRVDDGRMRDVNGNTVGKWEVD